ncbi:MAG TPA: LPS assembly lipoprotein LptE [Gammaproteobacteria bacterium]
MHDVMRKLAIVFSFLLLSACGFHLRGDLALPPAMQSTFISYNGTDAGLLRSVARALALADGGIARNPESATAILSLPVAGVQQRVLAKDTEGRPREYEIAVVLVFRVTTPEGVILVPSQEVQRSANVVLDPTQPLANAGDVARAVESLREEAVWDMLRRIAASDVRLPVENGIDDPLEARE